MAILTPGNRDAYSKRGGRLQRFHRDCARFSIECGPDPAHPDLFEVGRRCPVRARRRGRCRARPGRSASSPQLRARVRAGWRGSCTVKVAHRRYRVPLQNPRISISRDRYQVCAFPYGSPDRSARPVRPFVIRILSSKKKPSQPCGLDSWLSGHAFKKNLGTCSLA